MLSAHSAKTAVVISILFLAGCSGTGGMFPPAGDKPFKIQSDPAGAAVYVMGENIGVTPLQISQKDVFPNVYPGEKESLYGKVILRKAGCKDYTSTVSGHIVVSGLNAKLDCGNSTSSAATRSAPSETVEQRLDKIKELLNKGLISEDEAKKARARILNEL